MQTRAVATEHDHSHPHHPHRYEVMLIRGFDTNVTLIYLTEMKMIVAAVVVAVVGS